MSLEPSALYGVIPPISTPLTPERTLDVASFRRLIDRQVGAGIHGIFVLGSTSEAPLLPNAMQDAVIGTAVEHVSGRIPVIAGCIDLTTARVIDRGTRARTLGADGIVVCPPFYINPAQQEIIRHYRMVHEAVGLPILAYDIPSATHVKLQRPVLKALADDGTIMGLKDSSGQDANFRGVILDNTQNQDFRIFTGSELTADNAMFMGADGLVPGLGNVDPAGYVRLYDACVTGNCVAARAEQERLYRLSGISAVAMHGDYGMSAAAHGAFKAAIWLQGHIDHPLTMYPHTELTRDHHRQIAAILADCGLEVTREA
ncbi:MAG TPA: dihydrodipicolinate synthase family protein [Thermomicrobiales bacterium]|nr:dihydrodipicolinate synthase family protein [Thermomicrobiales bacterium]